MCMKILSLFVCALLINLVCYTPVAAVSKNEKEVEFAAKVKAEIVKLGTGKDARIKVKLRDKTKLKGYVSETKDDHFVVVNEKSGIATPVAYAKVKQVKGNNLSTNTVIGIVVAVALLVGIFIAFSVNEEDH